MTNLSNNKKVKIAHSEMIEEYRFKVSENDQALLSTVMIWFSALVPLSSFSLISAPL